MKLLDSNILIYSEKPENEQLRRIYLEENVYIASISIIEVLGYHKITAEESRFFQEIFQRIITIPLTDSVVYRAAFLRKANRMSLGDSIVAATTLEFGLTLYTANVEDFREIPDLIIKNPLIS